MTKKQQKMLDRIASASCPILEISLSSDPKTLRFLLQQGLVERVGHPTVVGPDNKPARAYRKAP
jgi:hypothetical protein